ncbi:cytidylyltransferase domain-containing protein [Anaerolinea thermophila]|uniref:Acylneuraminate cytidylyltransferase family protein n=1 Tax=Anaerolinea thermophila (strain DSM 14523 / JCM 11388 / NBRC 100420 / UNI-1) TaxID=926569 RepID=E8N1S8_ANATU|nr:acylneuraminate cytidylyltransferase family protein [Anaerolinea thermophila]BAJ62683.1 acylneuraminate cytidylyltransferase family protein [Anaerolinea thermophila UNI-1]
MTTALNRVVALVPMRHHSERVPGKNYRPLAGKPLYRHILDTLLAVPEISEVVIDTDSPVILEGLARDYPQVRAIERPVHLRDGGIPMNEILMHDTSLVPADLYLQTHSTNPLLRAETLSRAIQTLRGVYPAYDSLFGVTRLQVRLWDQLTRPINHNPAILLRTQDLPPVYMENSCVYLFTRQTLEQRRNRLGERPYMFEISQEEAWDIDEESTFQMVEFLLLGRQAKNQQG